MALSTLETSLTKHVRALLEQYPTASLKRFAFAISLISCLCAGSVLLFPLFTPVLHSRFGYSQFEINIVGSFTSLGMYLFLPILGYLADCHGPALLSVIAVIFFAPGYTIAAVAIVKGWSYWILAVSFAFVGCATSAFYFACLLSCAKIYPKSKGLTISAPVTCYGLSSLIGAQLLKAEFLKNDEGELDLFVTFRFFSVLYLFLGVFNFVSSCVVTIERDVLLRKTTDSTEESPLLEGEADETEDLVKNHKSKFKHFLTDISAYILLVCFLFTIGPAEMYITNMGSIIDTISPGSDISNQVSLHAIFSTLARLSLGALSDFLVDKFSISRVWLLLSIMVMGLFTQVVIASDTFTGPDYYIISALSGFLYGGLFTLFPTIVLSIWGAELFGSAYGFYMLSPAIGSSSFGMVYGIIYDAQCTAIQTLSSCISPVFWITAFGYLISSTLLVLAWRCLWQRKAEQI